MSDDNVTQLPIRTKPRTDSPLTVVHHPVGCRHLRMQVDYRLDHVECADCGEKLNPMWALKELAQADSQLIQRWGYLSAQVQLMSERVRCKCRFCGKFTHITTNVSDWALRELAEKIIKDSQK